MISKVLTASNNVNGRLVFICSHIDKAHCDLAKSDSIVFTSRIRDRMVFITGNLGSRVQNSFGELLCVLCLVGMGPSMESKGISMNEIFLLFV